MYVQPIPEQQVNLLTNYSTKDSKFLYVFTKKCRLLSQKVSLASNGRFFSSHFVFEKDLHPDGHWNPAKLGIKERSKLFLT